MPDDVTRYHVIRFADARDADALVLRLFEAAERAGGRVNTHSPVVAWTSSPFASHKEVFLSDGAMSLAQHAGLEFHVDRQIPPAELPAQSALLLGDATDPPAART